MLAHGRDTANGTDTTLGGHWLALGSTPLLLKVDPEASPGGQTADRYRCHPGQTDGSPPLVARTLFRYLATLVPNEKQCERGAERGRTPDLPV